MTHKIYFKYLQVMTLRKKSPSVSNHMELWGPPTNVPVTGRTTKHQTMAPHPAVTPSAQWAYSLSAQSATSHTSTGKIQGFVGGGETG